MSLNRRCIAEYDANVDERSEEMLAKSCQETKRIGTRSTAIFGKSCRWLTDRSSVQLYSFDERHAHMNMCQCEGHHCMRIHSVVALFSFLGVLNIDPETTD